MYSISGITSFVLLLLCKNFETPKRFFTIITYLPDLLVFVKVESILFFMRDYLPTYTLIQNGDVSPLMI